MTPACTHTANVECCTACCRKCVLDAELDARLEDDRSHPFYGHGWPTYHRMIEKPARLKGLYAESAAQPATL
jgi:hypothetical protein